MDLRSGRRKILKCVTDSKTKKMVRAGHKMRRFKDTDDFFVELPIDILVNILQRLPLKEAARTSVLSYMWKKLFLTRPRLVFDKKFFEENFGNKPNPGHAYTIFLYEILLSHSGDILYFVLYIPNLPCDWGRPIDQWLLKVVTKNIIELNLECEWHIPYKLHSCVYFCKNLTKLNLKNCILAAPAERGSFLSKLVELTCEKVAFASDSLDTVVLPLAKLKFTRCTGMENFKNFGHDLHYLYLHDCHVLKPNFLEKFPSVNSLIIGMTSNKAHEYHNLIELCKMQKTFPKLKRLTLNGPFLKLSAATVILDGLVPFRCLAVLTLHWIHFDDIDQISCALRVINNSPYLEILKITNIRHSGTPLESILNLMEARNCIGETLKLLTVEINSIKGLKSELLFIERILASSPKLKSMHVKCKAKYIHDELKIANDLMQFSRASPEAKVVLSGKYS